MARCERLRGAALRDVLGRAQGVLFDCDGVLWNGERAVPGAPELLERLARAGKAALFVSNNSRRARPELALRFARLGFGGLRAEQLFSSALCAALWLRRRLAAPPDAPACVFVLGGEGLRAELRAAGLRLAGDPGRQDPGAAAPRVRAVLVGYDEHFSFARLSEACAHLRDPDCLLVATDRDPWHPLSDGSRTPGERGAGGEPGGAAGRGGASPGGWRGPPPPPPPPVGAQGALASASGNSRRRHNARSSSSGGLRVADEETEARCGSRGGRWNEGRSPGSQPRPFRTSLKTYLLSHQGEVADLGTKPGRTDCPLVGSSVSWVRKHRKR